MFLLSYVCFTVLILHVDAHLRVAVLGLCGVCVCVFVCVYIVCVFLMPYLSEVVSLYKLKWNGFVEIWHRLVFAIP